MKVFEQKCPFYRHFENAIINMKSETVKSREICTSCCELLVCNHRNKSIERCGTIEMKSRVWLCECPCFILKHLICSNFWGTTGHSYEPEGHTSTIIRRLGIKLVHWQDAPAISVQACGLVPLTVVSIPGNLELQPFYVQVKISEFKIEEFIKPFWIL